MSTNKNTDKKELKKQLALKKTEQDKKKEALKRLKPLLYSFVLWGVLMAIVHIPVIHDFIESFFINFVVNSTVFIGNMLFFSVASTGSPLIEVAGFQMKVIFECTAYNFYFFAIALAVFGQWSVKDKILNFLIFISSIFILNAFRFIIMGYVGKYFPEAFHQIHDYVWTVVFGLTVFILYIWRNDKSQLNDV